MVLEDRTLHFFVPKLACKVDCDRLCNQSLALTLHNCICQNIDNPVPAIRLRADLRHVLNVSNNNRLVCL